MKMPVFSVITVTYNASQWLERTIESVRSQSYGKIDHLIIDGGSTDGTVDIIRKHASHLSYWISEPDQGLYDAMNKGLAAAQGDYVWFLNAGDTFHSPDTVKEVVQKLLPDQMPDIIYGETNITDAHGKSLGLRRLRAPEKLTWKSFRMGMLVCHQSFVVKRTMAPAYDLQYRLASDIDWCIRCLKQTQKVHNTHLILSDFLEAGISTAGRKEGLRERYRILCDYYGKIPVTILHIWFAVRFYTVKWLKGRV